MKWEYRTVDWGEIRKIGSRITGEDFIDANVDAGLNSLGQEGCISPTRGKSYSQAVGTSNIHLNDQPTNRTVLL
jgi:hypothetical protein